MRWLRRPSRQHPLLDTKFYGAEASLCFPTNDEKPFLNVDCVFKFDVITGAANEQVIAAKMNITCPWRIRKLRCDRHPEQTAAMVPPSVVIKDGMGGRRFARSFSWSPATERLMNAIFVVINSELVQLSLQVDCVPD